MIIINRKTRENYSNNVFMRACACVCVSTLNTLPALRPTRPTSRRRRWWSTENAAALHQPDESSHLVSPRLGAARRQLGSVAAEACSCSSPLAWAGRAAEPSARAANCRCQLSKWIFETNGIHHVPPGIHMPATWWIPLARGPRRRGGGELRHSAHAQPAAREECVDAVCPADKWYDNCYKLWWHLAAWVCGKQRRGWAPDSASVLPSSSSFLSVAVGCCCCRCCCFCYCYYQAKLALATWWCCHMPLATCFLPPNHSPKKGNVRQAAAEGCHLVVD